MNVRDLPDIRHPGPRRQDVLDLLDQVKPKIQELTRALEEELEKRPLLVTYGFVKHCPH